jgi:hypothetical protein
MSMKKSSLIYSGTFISLMVLFSFSACDKIDEATDVSFDVEFDGEFVINEASDLDEEPYSSTLTVDAKSNSKIADYAAKIKDIKVNKITYRITDYAASGAVTFLNGTMSFGTVGAAPSVVATVGSLNLQTQGGVEAELDINESELNEIAATLLETLEVAVHTEGTLSDTPVAFKVPVKFYVTVTANVL